jgi:uncharacterized protein (TIGR01777 family)
MTDYRIFVMRVLISGASGLIGSAVRSELVANGHSATALVRRAPSAGEVQWNPTATLDPKRLEGFDAVVHLAGKNIAGLWTEKFKREIRESRVQGTKTLATAAADSFRQAGKPGIFVAASAVGFYGDRGDEELTERSARGTGFLADVCQEWEDAASPAMEAGVRVVHLRMGTVLAKQGGALQALLPAFRLGLGGPVGNGRQYMSWVALQDVAGAFQFALAKEDLHGAANVVSPQSIRNREFVRELGAALHRPAVVPLPAFMVRALMGQMGESLLLASQRVVPAELEKACYRFRYPELSEALRAILR